MNETCKDCGKPVYWVDELGEWYHTSLWEMLCCPSDKVEPVAAEI